MRRFSQLRDDMYIGGRWHLGEVSLPGGETPVLDAALPFSSTHLLEGRVSHPGVALDFSLTSFGVPVASKRIGEVFKSVADSDVQCLDLRIPGHGGLVAINCTRTIRCIDESRSEFIKWTPEDHRPELAGEYRQVTKLSLDVASIPLDVQCFRVKGWLVAIIISETLKDAMELAGCRGARFVPLDE
jgi:hypothetical protein